MLNKTPQNLTEEHSETMTKGLLDIERSRASFETGQLLKVTTAPSGSFDHGVAQVIAGKRPERVNEFSRKLFSEAPFNDAHLDDFAS